jgi:hypothetical protein
MIKPSRASPLPHPPLVVPPPLDPLEPVPVPLIPCDGEVVAAVEPDDEARVAVEPMELAPEADAPRDAPVPADEVDLEVLAEQPNRSNKEPESTNDRMVRHSPMPPNLERAG